MLGGGRDGVCFGELFLLCFGLSSYLQLDLFFIFCFLCIYFEESWTAWHERKRHQRLKNQKLRHTEFGLAICHVPTGKNHRTVLVPCAEQG